MSILQNTFYGRSEEILENFARNYNHLSIWLIASNSAKIAQMEMNDENDEMIT